MFSVEDLTKKFHALDDEGKSIVFEQLTRNADAYSKIMPNVPLIKYILEGEAGVPADQHGPIINSYKEWIMNPKVRARLRSSPRNHK
jgi:hypothetical protein